MDEFAYFDAMFPYATGERPEVERPCKCVCHTLRHLMVIGHIVACCEAPDA